VLHGVLSKGDKFVELAVDAVKEPDTIRGLTNLIILGKILGSIDPALLHGVAAAVQETVETTHQQEVEPRGFSPELVPAAVYEHSYNKCAIKKPGVPSV